MSEVFISYFRADVQKVTILCDALERAGVPHWIDNKNLGVSEDWREIVTRQIRASRAFVLCASNRLQERPDSPVHYELEIAKDVLRGKSPRESWYFPVMLEPCELPALRLLGGRAVPDAQAVDATGDIHTASADLARRLKRFLRNAVMTVSTA